MRAPISHGKGLSRVPRRNQTDRFYPECESEALRQEQLGSDAFWIKHDGLNRYVERLSMGIVKRIAASGAEGKGRIEEIRQRDR